ncbi:hypothetical protein GC175_11335 [bacterium]|nr:hypothetical protein [bacterium]
MRKRIVLVAALLILVLSWSFTALAQENRVLLPNIFGGAGATVPQPTPTPTPSLPADPQSSLLETLAVDGGGEIGRWVIAL